MGCCGFVVSFLLFGGKGTCVLIRSWFGYVTVDGRCRFDAADGRRGQCYPVEAVWAVGRVMA